MSSHVRRTQDAITQVADGYRELQGMLVPVRGVVPESGRVDGGDVFAAAPVALHVVDTIAVVERVTREHQALVRGTLRLGVAPPRGGVGRVTATVTGLRFIRDSLVTVFADDPLYGDEVCAAMWRLFGRVSRACGRLPERPRRIGEPCPDCGESSLWIDVAGLRVACGMSGCGFYRSLDMAGGGASCLTSD